jgi:type II secretory pathway predicted ATPase ExeA
LYKAIASKMGIHPAFSADDIKEQIFNFFSEENEQGKFNCLIIDEAHSISIPMLDELRSFYDEGGNFSLILAGLPQLVTKTLNLAVTHPINCGKLFIEDTAFIPCQSGTM